MFRRIAPSHSHVRHIGWCDRRDPARSVFSWSGTGAAISFEGTRVAVRIEGEGMLELRLDGIQSHLLGPVMPREPLLLEVQESSSPHLLELRKRSEPVAGAIRFDGFDLPRDAATFPQTNHANRILFVGDSITCGYGNLASSSSEPFRPDTEDVFRSYAGVACARLGAELVASAWSGKGLVRNFDQEGDTMPRLWQLSDPCDPKSSIHPSEPPPILGVVNIGTNDVFHDDPDWTEFVAAAIALGRDIRVHFPSLPLVLLDGPLLSDESLRAPDGRFRPVLARIRRAFDEACKTLAAEAPTWRISLPSCEPGEPRGADDHPGLERHRLCGEALAASIRSLLPFPAWFSASGDGDPL